MAISGDDDFQIKFGKARAVGGGRAKRYVNRVLTAASKAGYAGGGHRSSARSTRFGRGAAAARLPDSTAIRWSRQRRVIVKARVVKLTGKTSKAAAAHLRYIQRDDVARDGEPGQLYSATENQADGGAFIERSQGDRHQFRFIVSPEDAGDLSDMRAYTRDLMDQMAEDLGTRLDWVAVDHHNTDNPHTHIVLRGVTDERKTLIIDRDYIARGMRAQASALATLELGPQSEQEIAGKLWREIDQERWTRIDRTIDRIADNRLIDMRPDIGSRSSRLMGRIIVARLQALTRMGLAQEVQTGVLRLRSNREAVLRRMGERDDIIKRMHRALGRQPNHYSIADPIAGPARRIVGRLVAKGLSDELDDRYFLIVDGTDGRAHHIDVVRHREIDDVRPGAIVAVGPSQTRPRPADRTVADLAGQNHGIYETERHLVLERSFGPKTGRDPDAYVEAHVRRLEALRRARIVERLEEGRWRIPNDFLDKSAAHNASRSTNGPVAVEIQSSLPLDKLTQAEGATWLDRQLLFGNSSTFAETGFGRDVRQAMADRIDHLISEGLADRRGRRVVFMRNLLQTLRTRELAAVAKRLERQLKLPHRQLATGDRIEGIYRRPIALASGRFAIIENPSAFCLVPWRPILERSFGREVAGTVTNTGVSWSLGLAPRRGIDR